MDKNDYQQKYGIENVLYTDEMEEYVKNINPCQIYHYDGVNCDSGLHPRKINLKFLENYKNNFDDIYEIINE